MEISDIKSLKNDIDSIRNIENIVEEYRAAPTCDKLNFGFNVDTRFKGSGSIEVYLGGYKGFYGSSDVYSIFNISNQKEFREAFIDVLNGLRPQILKIVADKMQEKLELHSKDILDEINSLKSMYNEINGDNE